MDLRQDDLSTQQDDLSTQGERSTESLVRELLRESRPRMRGSLGEQCLSLRLNLLQAFL